jgi:hypothetical protein
MLQLKNGQKRQTRIDSRKKWLSRFPKHAKLILELSQLQFVLYHCVLVRETIKMHNIEGQIWSQNEEITLLERFSPWKPIKPILVA